MLTVLVLQGPNLNLLGNREPDVYGDQSLEKIHASLEKQAGAKGAALLFFQSNHEGALIDRIHQAKGDGVDWIIFNPAAFTHTSVALRDALLGVKIPFVEVHLSNVYQRESFRQHSFFSDIAKGVICGFGAQGYTMALDFVLSQHK
jgi:3-dehydroquinate dehydratase-2